MPFLKKWVCSFYINDEKFLVRIGHSHDKQILRWVPILHGASHPSWGFPGDSDGKESACNAGDPVPSLGSGRFPGEGIVYPLQYPCLENPMDRGTRRTTVHGVTKSQTQLSNWHFHISSFVEKMYSEHLLCARNVDKIFDIKWWIGYSNVLLTELPFKWEILVNTIVLVIYCCIKHGA